jgi:anti-sigma B factor antagonist
MALKLSTRDTNGVTIIDLSGRIVFGDEAASLREKVKSLIPTNSRIILNLSQISYIDSGGIGTMVSLFTSARAAGGDIKLVNLTKRIGDLLQITKLITVFETYDNENQAIQAFAQKAAS